MALFQKNISKVVFIYVNLCGNCIVIVNESQTIISRKILYCHFEMVELLGVRGFSETYIRLMRQFFETWEVLIINHQPWLMIWEPLKLTRLL